MTSDRHERLAGTSVYLVVSFVLEGTERAFASMAAAAATEEVTSAGPVRHVIGAVQLRCKAASTAARRELLMQARELLPSETLLLINDDLEAVIDAHGATLADGVHLGRDDAAALPGGLSGARARLGPEFLLGTSTRSLAEIEAALAAGADHVGFGAMAPTVTKADTQRADPIELAHCLAEYPKLPIFPIGGLGPDTLHLVIGAGAHRAAIGAAIQNAPDPAAAARASLQALRVR